MHIPAGLAYGSLTDLNPVNGIYTSFFTGITYILFGTSRHLSVGTYAVTSLMVYSCISRVEQKYSLDSMDSSSLLMKNSSSFTLYKNDANETNLNNSMKSPFVLGDGILNKDEDANYQLKLRISGSLAFWCGTFQVRNREKKKAFNKLTLTYG
jgi:MFS superfamily sulfate permease-like transporter